MISSISNSRVKNIMNIKNSARARRKQNCFLVEGPRMFFETPQDRLLEVYVTQGFEQKYGDRLAGCHYEVISDGVCRHLSDTKTPQGVMAVVRMQESSVEEMLSGKEAPCLFLLENLQDPGNLGTILRTSEGAGVNGIILNRESVDPYNPKVIRSTMGAIFRVPFVIVNDFADVLPRLREAGVRTYAAHLEGEDFYRQDYRKGCAFFIGNEGNGLSEALALQADSRIRIPMKGQVESLNAAVAATVLMYEALRQREWM